MIPIITYHALGDEKSPVFTAFPVFEKQLAAFAEAGYESISLSLLIQWLNGAGEAPENGLVFTFDDAYESVYSQAWPLMEEYGFKGTLFVISEYCGRNNQWPGQVRGIPERPLMSWDQVAEMYAGGWELGAHSRTHPILTRLSPALLEDEILGSQADIKNLIGCETRLFAAPYGESNTAVEQIIRQNFDGAVSTDMGLVDKGSDQFHLARIDAYYLRIALIERLKGPLARFYLNLRQGMRRVRRMAKDF